MCPYLCHRSLRSLTGTCPNFLSNLRIYLNWIPDTFHRLHGRRLSLQRTCRILELQALSPCHQRCLAAFESTCGLLVRHQKGCWRKGQRHLRRRLMPASILCLVSCTLDITAFARKKGRMAGVNTKDMARCHNQKIPIRLPYSTRGSTIC